jgi:hypothetical protein
VLTAIRFTPITFAEVDISTYYREISGPATSSSGLAVVLGGFERSTLLHAFLTFFEMFVISDIFYMPNASLLFAVLDIFDDFVALNSPPSPVVVEPGLWAALGVGARS